MKRPDPTETALDALRESGDVAPFLRNRSCRVVAKAAEKAVRLSAPVAAELVGAFRRFLQEPAKRDPGCVAKLAIAKALVELEDPAAEVFFAGVRHVQREPVWGGSVDTAAELRGICAIGLARMAHPEALLEAVRLLCDKEQETRIGALRALADSGKAEAELVLRYKAALGDKKEEVQSECFAAILRLGPRARALSYLSEFLKSGDAEAASAAALALGESRMAEAWPVLKEAFENETNGAIQSGILLGMALLRRDEGIDYLFEHAEKGRERIAAVAVEALAMYREDEAIRNRMEHLVSGAGNPAIRKAFHTYWVGTG